MWKSRRKSSRETDSINGLFRRSASKHNFVRSSLKDVENLFANDEDDSYGFNETLAKPSPCSTATTAARRLSIFHRVHLANKFARAFSVNQISSPEKSPPESKNDDATEKSAKSDRLISIPVKSSPESNNDVAAETKSDHVVSLPAKYLPESNNVTAEGNLTKPNRLISIPGAEKRVVVYTTSLRVVRPTFEACRTVQSILRGFRVSIDERDLSMDSRFLNELRNLMAEDDELKSEKTKLTLPTVFIGGRYIGGAEEVRQLHETGELKKIIDGLLAVSSAVCGGCGGFGFILCDECRGSHKCYSEKGGFRSCTLCNENGLVRCTCFDR
ncbi:putative glutaredoxin, Thioredoxin-like superfamily [Helianthus annuus]|nr:putative glutaredoxin, Thioredoxin-like superfamily [Helianthus annuus]